MIYPVNSIKFYSGFSNNIYSKKDSYMYREKQCFDSVKFTGRSLPSEYKTVFDYLSAEILGRNKRFQVNGALLSASRIKKTVGSLFEDNKVFDNFELSDYSKIKWKSYIPQDVREYSINKINAARKARLKEWTNVLTNPENFGQGDNKLSKKLDNNSPLKLVVWDAVTSELKADNRHIPVPFDYKALVETIERFEKISPKDRAVTCAKPSFVEFYTYRLRDDLLMDMGLSNNEAVWVKIPSIKHDKKNKSKNISKLEILSNKNWCTRSSVDKAEDALTDGDFYIYLRRNKTSKIWEPSVGMTSLKGKIDQIQGKENDNIVPITFLPEIKDFISKSKLKCASGIDSEGPKSWQGILISDKLSQKDVVSGKTFFKAIKEKDFQTIFGFLGINAQKTESGMFRINNYRPVYPLDSTHGFAIPYSMFGVNENELLSLVEVIDKDLVLNNKNQLLSSNINAFPKNLKYVGGRIYCNKMQYEMFKDDILKVVDNNKSKICVTA